MGCNPREEYLSLGVPTCERTRPPGPALARQAVRRLHYYVTALLGRLIGVAGLLIADPALRHSIVGLSFGLLLWLTVAAVLAQALTLIMP